MDRCIAHSLLVNANMTLSTTPKRFTLERTSGDPTATNFPANSGNSSGGMAFLDHLEATVDTIAGGAANLVARFTWDTAGDEGCQPPVSATIHAALTTVAKGTAFWGIDSGIHVPKDKTLYCWLSTDVGTATLSVGRLYWRL